MVGETGFDFSKGEKVMEKMYGTFKTAFIMIGVCFTVYGCCGFIAIW